MKAGLKERKGVLVRSLGSRIKKAFKEINGLMYLVNIYQKDSLYTFDMALYLSRRNLAI